MFYQAFKANSSAAIGLESLLIGCSVLGLAGVHTWQARLAWSFSRDKGFPLSSYLGSVARPPFGVPLWAHVWSCAWTSLLGCLYLGSSVAFNSFVSGGILLQCITYSLPIILLWIHGRSNITPGPFWCPRLGPISNVIVVAWSVVALIFYSFPWFQPVEAAAMNYVSCVIVGMFLYAGVYWVLYGNKYYTLPPKVPHAFKSED
jgi:choline transport protein